MDNVNEEITICLSDKLSFINTDFTNKVVKATAVAKKMFPPEPSASSLSNEGGYH
jgi:hypothetical protein